MFPTTCGPNKTKKKRPRGFTALVSLAPAGYNIGEQQASSLLFSNE